jgi:hypothetical protein
MPTPAYNTLAPPPAGLGGVAPPQARPGTIGYSPAPMPRRQDPSQQTADVAPQDLVQTPYEASQRQKKIVEDFNKDFKEDQDAQRYHHAEWFTSWSMYSGEQWRAWSRSQNRFLDTHPGPGEMGYDANRRYRSYNKIKPLVFKTKSKILMNDPNAVISPQTAKDIDAAREYRAVVSHLQRLNDIESLSDELTDWSLQVGAPCLKIYWDPTKPASIPTIGPDGQIIQTADVEKMGDIVWEILSPFEWFGDSQAKRFGTMRRIWHAKTVPLQYLQERYEDGWKVKPDAFVTDDNGVEGRMSMIVGDAPRGGLAKPNGVLLKEKWEKASPAYPNGRYILVAGDVLLAYAEKWPNGDGKTFPFVPYYYQKRLDTVYGYNAVSPLIHSQILINKMYAKMEEWADLSALYAIAPKGAQMGADAFERNVDRLMTTIYHRPGFAPKLDKTPDMSPNMGICAQFAETFMRDSIGVHEQSDGSTTAGVDTGVAIQLLQEADDTQLGPVRKLISNFWQEVYSVTLPIAQKNYLEPRLLMMQDTVASKPDDAKAQVLSFQHLSTGRIVISPGSTTPANPTLQSARVMDLFKSGALRPENIDTAIPFLQLLLTENSEKVIDDVLAAAEKIAAGKPSPADQLKMELQMETAKLHVENMAKAELAKMMADLKTTSDGEMAAVDLHKAQAMAEIDAHSKMAAIALQGQIDHALLTLKGEQAEALAENAKTQIRLQGELTPVMVGSEAEKLGMDTDEDATLKALGKVDLQPKPAPAAGGAKPTQPRRRR